MTFSCFKQFLPNVTATLLLIKLNEGTRILLDVAGGLILSYDNPLDFHTKISLLLPIFLKPLKTGRKIK